MAFSSGRKARAIGALGIVIGLTAIAYAETKPQIEIKTKSVEVTVKVDPALRKFPGLFEDSLAGRARRSSVARFAKATTFRELIHLACDRAGLSRGPFTCASPCRCWWQQR